jgi:dihydrofolate reductase
MTGIYLKSLENGMRKVIVSEFLSLDGVMEDPGGSETFEHGGWTRPYWNDEIGKFKFDELFASDALLLGRVTYQGFAAAWPSQKDEAGFADRMNSLPKYVVSATLAEAGWNNSTIIRANITGAISKIKQLPGQDILVAGSRRLVQMLMQYDLVDRYQLLVYPVLLGSGKRLFENVEKAVNLKPTGTKSFKTGVTLLTFDVAGKSNRSQDSGQE